MNLDHLDQISQPEKAKDLDIQNSMDSDIYHVKKARRSLQVNVHVRWVFGSAHVGLAPMPYMRRKSSVHTRPYFIFSFFLFLFLLGCSSLNLLCSIRLFLRMATFSL